MKTHLQAIWFFFIARLKDKFGRDLISLRINKDVLVSLVFVLLVLIEFYFVHLHGCNGVAKGEMLIGKSVL